MSSQMITIITTMLNCFQTHKMSRIFNYHAPKVARIYDQLRIPQGIDVIAGLLRVLCGKSLSVCNIFSRTKIYFTHKHTHTYILNQGTPILPATPNDHN